MSWCDDGTNVFTTRRHTRERAPRVPPRASRRSAPSRSPDRDRPTAARSVAPPPSPPRRSRSPLTSRASARATMPAAGKENARKRNAPAAAGARDVITVEVVDGPAKGQVFTKQVRRAPRTRRRGRPARGSPARGVAVARSARVCSPRVSCAEALPTRSRRDAARFPSRPGDAAHRPLPPHVPPSPRAAEQADDRAHADEPRVREGPRGEPEARRVCVDGGAMDDRRLGILQRHLRERRGGRGGRGPDAARRRRPRHDRNGHHGRGQNRPERREKNTNAAAIRGGGGGGRGGGEAA